jgi:hypothetical protein
VALFVLVTLVALFILVLVFVFLGVVDVVDVHGSYEYQVAFKNISVIKVGIHTNAHIDCIAFLILVSNCFQSIALIKYSTGSLYIFPNFALHIKLDITGTCPKVNDVIFINVLCG